MQTIKVICRPYKYKNPTDKTIRFKWFLFSFSEKKYEVYWWLISDEKGENKTKYSDVFLHVSFIENTFNLAHDFLRASWAFVV